MTVIRQLITAKEVLVQAVKGVRRARREEKEAQGAVYLEKSNNLNKSLIDQEDPEGQAKPYRSLID